MAACAETFGIDYQGSLPQTVTIRRNRGVAANQAKMKNQSKGREKSVFYITRFNTNAFWGRCFIFQSSN